jgi:hypothetical protein
MGSDIMYAKLKSCSFGFALGVTNGLFMMLLAWAAMQWGFASAMVTLVSGIYYGYDATWMGGLYGFGWGFLDGFVFGVIAACIYNMCLCCSCRKDK